MNAKDLEKDSLILEWLSVINPKPLTRRTYTFAMQYYTEYTAMSPEDLLLEAETEIKDGILPRQRQLQRRLIDYREYLQQQGIAPLTVKNRMTGVLSFYKSFDIEVPTLPKSGMKAKPLQQHKEIPTKEDLQTVIKHCDQLERAILLIGVSSGLAVNEIRELTIRDFKKGYDPETGITTLKLRRIKEEWDFVTFLSPEASKAVLDYLEYREREPKVPMKNRIDQLDKQRIYSNSNYLLIRRKVPDKYLKNHDEKLRQLTDGAVISIYRQLAERAHKNTDYGVWGLIRSYNVRKYFNSAMLKAGADSFFTEFLMGRILDDTRVAYFRASPGKLRDIYQKYVPYLTIQKESDVSESPEYLRIKLENQILQAETARHAVERSELQELRKELASVKDFCDVLLDEATLPVITKEYLANAIAEKQRKRRKLE